jgi:outer membrane protein TolC
LGLCLLTSHEGRKDIRVKRCVPFWLVRRRSHNQLKKRRSHNHAKRILPLALTALDKPCLPPKITLMKLIFITSILAIVLAATGCVLTHPTDPYEPVAPRFKPTTEASARRTPKSPSVSEALTRREAIDIALANNPGLAARRRDVSAADAREDIASSRRLPDMRARSSYHDYINDQPLVAIGGSPQGQTFTDDIATVEVLVDVPIFTGGRITSQIRAAELLRKASHNTLARTRHELVFNVSSVFYSILAQDEVIESLKFSRKSLREHLEQVEDLIENQKATKVDRLRTEVRLANVREKLARAENNLRIKRHALANLLGIEDQAGVLKLDGELAFEEGSPEPANEAIVRAYKQREDYQAARRELEAHARRVDAARADRWPDVAFEAAYGNRWDVSHVSESEDVGRVGLALIVPLFEGGRLGAAIREEKSKLGAAQERLRKLKLQIRLEVQTALSNVASARERVEATRKAVEKGRESLRIERLKHRVGEAVITDVLDAQADTLDSQTNYYRALADYNTALAKLDLATGRN